MAPTHRHCTPQLAIQIDAPHALRAGDTICGKVLRAAHIVAPAAVVTLTLHGRAKVKIKETGENNPTYRSEWILFKPIRGTLYEGPIHVPIEGPPREWTFAVSIPEHVSPATVTPGSSGNKQDRSYLSLSPQNVAQQPLPPTFHFDNNSGFLVGWAEGYVEYWLEAALRSKGNIQGYSSHQATLPITLLAQPPPTPVCDFGMQVLSRTRGQAIPVIFKSPAFLEPQPKSGFQFRKLFQLTPTPQLHVTAIINVPSVIQLEHTRPVPILMRLEICREYTHESLGSNPPPVILGLSHTDHATHTTRLDINKLQPNIQIIVPYAPEELNLADHIPFTLRSRDILALTDPPAAHRFAPSEVLTVYPDFTTYNIRHTHRADWTFAFAAGGKTVQLSVEMPLTILPPSGATSNAPPPRNGATVGESSLVGGKDEGEPPAYARAAEGEPAPLYAGGPSQIVVDPPK
ncbi:hypothetical protein HDU87_007229 [Geranomyces variabilis]|uniref:Arrestin-like N-terminal domain-containing protein n=1 Tax=Geranomyces variabilis TaxID=109894 RepID=A0AAD5TEM7_9FUNG|nr:hypothetical protein HDU87_007229 [Geranomyces variabilis]